MVGYFNPRHVKKIRGFKIINCKCDQSDFSDFLRNPRSPFKWLDGCIADSGDDPWNSLKMRYILDDSRVDFRGLPHCWTSPFGCVWKCRVPHCTQWFCWSLSLLNGYFIGNINPTFSDKPIFQGSLKLLGMLAAPFGRMMVSKHRTELQKKGTRQLWILYRLVGNKSQLSHLNSVDQC